MSKKNKAESRPVVPDFLLKRFPRYPGRFRPAVRSYKVGDKTLGWLHINEPGEYPGEPHTEVAFAVNIDNKSAAYMRYTYQEFDALMTAMGWVTADDIDFQVVYDDYYQQMSAAPLRNPGDIPADVLPLITNPEHADQAPEAEYEFIDVFVTAGYITGSIYVNHPEPGKPFNVSPADVVMISLKKPKPLVEQFSYEGFVSFMRKNGFETIYCDGFRGWLRDLQSAAAGDDMPYYRFQAPSSKAA